VPDRFPGRIPRIAYGGDYNPEQWPRDVWREDVRLMREAGVNLVTVGVFSWALLEPQEGRFDFAWLDEVLDLLHGCGIAVDLATATASPPPWLSRRYPDTLPVDREGRRLWPGGRQAWCPSSRTFRDKALTLVEAMATRYGEHPAVVLWHVSNELGCHNAHCFCDISAEAFRRWLQTRYGDLDSLNRAWGTAFWSQRYGSWDEVLPPRIAPALPNPTQQLDFRRFSSDELLDHYRAEREILRRISPAVPVTTNFMVTDHFDKIDYRTWAPEQDVVSNDHYLRAADPEGHVELAMSADTTRGLSGGAPWLLMEQSTSAVNWQPRNVAKQPGQLLRNSLQHVARGADGICFFQWRASRAGAEKFHSALVPHAGTDTKVWREVVQLGRTLSRLSEVSGTRVDAGVAILFNWEAWWASELDSHPSVDIRYTDMLQRCYRALWDAGVTADVLHPSADLSRYRLVVVPTLYLVSDDDAAALDRFVGSGGTALVTYFSGIVDENDHIRLGGYPGAFRDLLGLTVEEFFPLRQDESVHLDDGSSADVWTEWLRPTTAEVIASYVDGPLPGVPAISRNQRGQGAAWYVATRLDGKSLQRVVDRVVRESGAAPAAPAPPGVEVVRRVGDDRSYLFVLNHSDEDAEVAAHGVELLSSRGCEGRLRLPAGSVAVVREADPPA
jgi:beta-galactosidase